MQNFATPYFSRDIAEFWRRWHISLSTWFRDYLYIPLGGSRGGTWMKVRNTFIIFLVSGFWHGANWTFIVWGGLNALYFLPLLLLKRNRTNLGVVAEGRMLPNLRELWQMGTTFLLTVLAWVFFRAESINQAFGFFRGILNSSLLNIPLFDGRRDALMTLVFIFSMFTIEWVSRHNLHPLNVLPKNKIIRFLVYYVLFVSILLRADHEQEFIYFQF
jgi:D-alanyl-lipoteichoic acid acyltransferase DltB (MBOAT superfamily)